MITMCPRAECTKSQCILASELVLDVAGESPGAYMPAITGELVFRGSGDRADRRIRWTTIGRVALLALIGTRCPTFTMHRLVALRGPGSVAHVLGITADPDQGLDSPAGSRLSGRSLRAGRAVQVPNPRPVQQVHCGI